MSTTGVHKSEKKEVCGQPTVEARARARDGCRSRWGALAEQGEAGSGLGRRPLPCQCGPGDIAPVCVELNSKQAGRHIQYGPGLLYWNGVWIAPKARTKNNGGSYCSASPSRDGDSEPQAERNDY